MVLVRSVRAGALALLLCSVPALAHAETLREALTSAYLFNPQILSALLNVKATAENIALAKAGKLPQIGAQATISNSYKFGSTSNTLTQPTVQVGASYSQTLFDNYFRAPPGAAAPLLATDLRNSIENAYYRIALPRVTLGVLVLEWAPRASTVAWANRVLSQFAHDRVIVVTHAYLYEDSTRYDWHTRGAAQRWNPLWYDMDWLEQLYDREYDGEMLWNALVRRHPGIFLVLCGHVGGSGTGQLASRGDGGNLVEQVLANFQLLDQGGLGYLRLFEIQPDGRSMRMKTYSPSLGQFAIASAQQAVLPIEPALW